jgi:hypothetical protein
MKLIQLSIFLLLPFFTFSQTGKKKAMYFFDSITKSPVQDVMVKDYSGIDTLTYISNSRGQIVISQSIEKLQTNHLNYKDTIITTETNKVLITPSTNIMEEAVIQNKETSQKGVLLRAIASPFAEFKINFSHNTNAALFIPGNNKIGKTIKNLRYEVIDIFGVKNLKYLPFKAALYSVDTITLLPDKEVFESEIVMKSDNKRWVTIDITNHNIRMPQQGIFIVFKVLEKEAYKVFTIQSKEGVISAVPTVRAKLFNENNPHRSYTSDQMDKWDFVPCHFEMEIDFQD